MLYTQWVQRVLEAMVASENTRTRLVGIPAAALREPLSLPLSDVDAITDAVYELEALGLVDRRPAGTYNLTRLGRQAADQSIEDVCGATIYRACTRLADGERSFLQTLLELSQSQYDSFARMHYVNVDAVFEQIGLRDTNEQQESFLLPLVLRKCIDYREYAKDRDARPLFTGVICATTVRELARSAVGDLQRERTR